MEAYSGREQPVGLSEHVWLFVLLFFAVITFPFLATVSRDMQSRSVRLAGLYSRCTSSYSFRWEYFAAQLQVCCTRLLLRDGFTVVVR
jgi:hypothetical protein